MPTVRLKPLRSMVPLVWVNVRVEPIVKASSRRNVPPTPSKVRGKSSVLPLVLMVRGVPEVEAKVCGLAPAVTVMPVENVTSPKIVLGTLFNVPENPVKFTLRTLPLELGKVKA